MALADVLVELGTDDVSYRGLVAPGVHVFAMERAMSRVRSYQSAGLTPIGGRGVPLETVLIVHVHEDAAGKVARVEGFNGPDGERHAERLSKELSARGLVPPGAVVRPSLPLRECPHSTRPIPRGR